MVASKLEVLLAIASSEFNQTTHVHYMPVGKQFTGTLRQMRAQGFIEPLNTSFYKLTVTGWNYIRTQDKSIFEKQDAAIDKFVDSLQ